MQDGSALKSAKHAFFSGKLKLFFGYRLMDGTLVSNEQAIDITIPDKP